MINDIKLDKLRLAIRRLTMISRPVGMKIIEMLQSEEKMNVGQIQKRLNIAQPTVSYYLINMSKKGILNAKRNGQQIFYSLNKEIYSKILDSAEVCCG